MFKAALKASCAASCIENGLSRSKILTSTNITQQQYQSEAELWSFKMLSRYR